MYIDNLIVIIGVIFLIYIFLKAKKEINKIDNTYEKISTSIDKFLLGSKK